MGPLNAIDFVQFYTLGHLAGSGRMAQAYNGVSFHAAPAALVPASAEYIYPPVYPPQTALLFIPFSRLSYGLASLAWTALNVLLYVAILWYAWRALSDALTDRVLVFFAAAAFPPFWYDIFQGQIAVVVLAACCLAWVALGRGHHLLAGCALGLLAIKPRFGLPFVAIVLARRDWAMLSGALACAAVQTALVWALFGTSSSSAYVAYMALVLPHADLLEAKPYLSHSLRAVIRLLPAWIGLPMWGVVAGWVLAARADARAYGYIVYGLFITLFVPTAAVIGVQLSVLLMLWLFRDVSVWIESDVSRLAEAPIAEGLPAAAPPPLSPSAGRTAPR